MLTLNEYYPFCCGLIKRNENLYVITIMFPINKKLVFVFLNSIRLTHNGYFLISRVQKVKYYVINKM